MGWDGPIITDSGGFQVFSMGYGNVAAEIKKTGGPTGSPSAVRIEERGVTFRSHIDGVERFMAPETSMEVQAALGSDIALVFDECTPFHVTREYTARSTERTHRWLERCLDWHDRARARRASSSSGSSRAASSRTCAPSPRTSSRPAAATASRSADRSARTSRRCTSVVEMATGALGGDFEHKPRHLLGIGDVDDLIRGVELGIDTFDCVMPTRLARHGVAIVPDPEKRWRVDLTAARFKESDEPIMEGCPCPACTGGLSRGYLRYLAKHRELTGARLLTLHNLAYLARLMADLRQAIGEGRLAERAAALRAGDAPRVLAGHAGAAPGLPPPRDRASGCCRR